MSSIRKLGDAVDDSAQDDGEIFEATVFLHHFNDLTDARQQAKVVYPLDEVLLLALLGTLAGAETFTDIAPFGEKKLALLRRFRPFKDRTPPHDRIGDIFATLDAEQFQHCFVAWVASVTGLPKGVIAIDGKTVRRSGRKNVGESSDGRCDDSIIRLAPTVRRRTPPAQSPNPLPSSLSA